MINSLGKRAIDFLLALVGLGLFFPLLLGVSLAVWLLDGRPVFFTQVRVGKFGKPFTLLKFRTMKTSSPGKLITVGGDARITSIGRFLRKTKLDELPQLFNVLLGQMSFVGPRPEVPKYVSMYSPEQNKVLNLKPGITDPASLIFFNESEVLANKPDPEKYYIEHLMPEKIRVNLRYGEKANPLSDIWIITLTVLRVLGIRIDYMSERTTKSHG